MGTEGETFRNLACRVSLPLSPMTVARKDRVNLTGRSGTLALLISIPLSGAQQGDSRSGLIVGQVRDAGTQRPVASAVVSLNGPPAPTGRHTPVLTGSDGRFIFREMARGNYTITASKGGYVEGAYGRSRPGGSTLGLTMADGERRDDVVVSLWRQAAVSGTVVDESGERQIGVQIRAYRRAVVGGRSRFVPAGFASTDDRGMYRIGTLMPGDYIVGTASRQSSVPLSLTRDAGSGGAESALTAELRASGGALIVRDGGYVLGRGSATPPPPEGGRLVVYPPTFHPFAPAGDAASVISLASGQEHEGADIQITPVSTAGVSGVVIGPDGPVTATPLRLVSTTSLELPSEADGLTTVTDRSGAFTFPAVPSGHYSLRLVRGRVAIVPVSPGMFRADSDRSVIWVDQPLSVGSEDIENLGVTALAGLRVSGRLEFEGDPARPRGALPSVQIALEAAEVPPGTAMQPYVARPDGAGEFASPGVPGGKYYVRIPNSPAGWMFKSATLDGRDIADTPLTLASDAPHVVITFTDRWSGLRGRVQADRGSPADLVVIVFPTDAETWGSSGLTPRRLRSTRATAAGEYSFNLPPGDYFAVAISADQAAEWQDPVFLQAASRVAARVRIADGERKLQDLRLQAGR